MKRRVSVLAGLLIFISACSNDISNSMVLPEQPVAQQETFSAMDYQAEASINSNKESLTATVENIFAQNFADDIDVSTVAKLAPATAADIQKKGGILFNLLNKSKLAQKVGYFFVDYPVRAKFNKKSKADAVQRITETQIEELRKNLQPGDLILCGNNGSFIHAILYFGNDVIIHSLATKGVGNQKFVGVVKETLTEYLFRAERDKFLVLRNKNMNPDELTKISEYATKQIGKSYDTLFLMNSDSRFYCTELVYQSVMQMSNPPRITPHKAALGWQLITNEDFMASPDLDTVWSLNVTRPQVRKG